MYQLNFQFNLESNYLIGGILLGVTAVVCAALFVLGYLKKMKALYLPGAIASFVLIVVNTLFCFNMLIMAAFLISVATFALFLTLICTEYHKNTIYDVPFTKLYLRMFFPVYIATMLFRPWFSEATGAINRLFPALGLNVTGVYTYDVLVLNASRTGTVLNIISVVEVLLFIVVLAMQVLLIWRQFADPDNAISWATTSLFVTVIGCAFIYGVYSSPNFQIATFMEASEKLNLSTGQFETVFKPALSEAKNITLAPVIAILMCVANRLFYFEKNK